LSQKEPGPPRLSYLRRFAIWLGILWIVLAAAFAFQVWETGATQAYAAENLWLQARLAAGAVVLAALLACVRGMLKGDSATD
jgi:hypothetical protein